MNADLEIRINKWLDKWDDIDSNDEELCGEAMEIFTELLKEENDGGL